MRNSNAATLGAAAGTVNTNNATLNDTNAISAGQLIHAVIEVEWDGPQGGTNPQYRMYLNGALVGTLSTPGGGTPAPHRLQHLNDVNNWLGKSNDASFPLFDGTLHEFRIYNNDMATNDITRNWILGPEAALDAQIPKLVVNTTNGQVKIVNPMGQALPAIDFYRITSDDGDGISLNPAGWTSLDGATTVGEGWDPANGTSGELAEFYLDLDGYSGITAGSEFGLGSAFVPGSAQDLEFEYGIYNGFTVSGEVEYVMSVAVPGDYNNDGTVNAADYTTWRNNLGDANETDINNNGDGGGVTASDYTFWKARYGNTSGSGASVDSDSNVPEPTTFVSLVLGSLLMLGSVSRRRVS
jgi:hypothetical protein